MRGGPGLHAWAALVFVQLDPSLLNLDDSIRADGPPGLDQARRPPHIQLIDHLDRARPDPHSLIVGREIAGPARQPSGDRRFTRTAGYLCTDRSPARSLADELHPQPVPSRGPILQQAHGAIAAD